MVQRKAHSKEIPLAHLTLMALLLTAVVAVIALTAPILFPRIVFAQSCGNPGGCTLASTSGGGGSSGTPACSVAAPNTGDGLGSYINQPVGAVMVSVTECTAGTSGGRGGGPACTTTTHCVATYAGNTYFIPRKTLTELQSFLNAISRLSDVGLYY